MKVKITNKQPISNMCFVCGTHNQYGLKSAFYDLENGEILALFTPRTEHQSYPGRLHGGIAAAILDEAIGRAILNRHDRPLWGVTLEFSMKFRKPVPLGEEIQVIARIDRENKRSFSGSGEILCADGSHAIEATGRYLKRELDQLGEFDPTGEGWLVYRQDDDPQEVERIPGAALKLRRSAGGS